MKSYLNRLVLIVLSAFLLVLVGCQRAEIDYDGQETLTVQIADSRMETRTSFDSAEGKFKWNTGDEIAIYFSDATSGRYENYELNVVPDGSKATIVSSLPQKKVRSFYAVYPADAAVAPGTNNALKVVLPSSYDISSLLAGGHEDFVPVPMVAKNDPSSMRLDFVHVGGLLQIRCYKIKPEATTVKVTFDKDVTGTFTVSLPASGAPFEPTISSTANTGKNVVTFTIASTDAGIGSGVNPLILNVPVPCASFGSVKVEAFDYSGASLNAQTYSEVPLQFLRHHGKHLAFTELSAIYEVDGLGSAIEFDYTGGIDQLAANFKSFKTVDGVETPVPFEIQYSPTGLDGSWSNVAPDWLTMVAGIDYGGSVEGEEMLIAIQAKDNDVPTDANGVVLDAHTLALRDESLPLAVDVDLSTINVATGQSISRTTANCYVVQAPGTYRFPVVYGNAIANNETNESAFRAKKNETEYYPDEGEFPEVWYYATATRPIPGTFTVNGYTIRNGWLGRYLDHADSYIYYPYIREQLAHKPSPPSTYTACLLWMDSPGLIDPVDVVYHQGGTYKDDYISFAISRDNIAQGNAVLALKADDVIVWSWHIWVTDQPLGPSSQLRVPYLYGASATNPGTTYDNYFSPIPLGWCDSKTVSRFDERSYYVRAVQLDQDGVASSAVLIKEKAGPVTIVAGSCPYYQPGRKDPMPAFNGDYNSPGRKACYPPYSENPYHPRKNTPGYMTIGYAIQHPNLEYFSDTSYLPADWSNPTFGNCWNSTVFASQQYGRNSPAIMTKTIYDPTPVGFTIPDIWKTLGWYKNANNFDSHFGERDSVIGSIVTYKDTDTFFAFLPAMGGIFYNALYDQLEDLGTRSIYKGSIPNMVDVYYGLQHTMIYGTPADGLTLQSSTMSYACPALPVRE